MSARVVLVTPTEELGSTIARILSAEETLHIEGYRALDNVPNTISDAADLFIVEAGDHPKEEGVLEFLREVKSGRYRDRKPAPSTIIVNGGTGLDDDEILVGVVAHVERGRTEKVIATRARAALAPPTFTELEAIVSREGYTGIIPDWLYPDVKYIIDPTQKRVTKCIVTKYRENATVAQHEYEALTYLGVHAHARGNAVIVEHIMGRETADIMRMINARLRKLQAGDNPTTPKTLHTLRWALLEKQISALANFQAKPYIPCDASGNEYVDNPNTIEYYKTDMQSAFRAGQPSIDTETLATALTVFDDILGQHGERVVRYLDMYARNNGLTVGRINATLNDYIEALRGDGSSGDTNIAQRTRAFVDDGFRHFDPHRVIKRMYDLEDLFHIVGDPQAQVTPEEEEHLYCLFLLKKTLEEEKSREMRDGATIRSLETKLREFEERTAALDQSRRLASFNEIKDLIPEPLTNDREYYHVVEFHRIQRWHYLVAQKYLPKYKQNMDSAEERLRELMRTNKRDNSPTTLFRYLRQSNDRRFLRTREYYSKVKNESELEAYVPKKRMEEFRREANIYRHNEIMHKRYVCDLEYYDQRRRQALAHLMRAVAGSEGQAQGEAPSEYNLETTPDGIRITYQGRPLELERYREHFAKNQLTNPRMFTLLRVDYMQRLLEN